MRVLIAFDKFKDSLTAPAACAVAAAQLSAGHAGWSLDLCPLTDGGEGFAEILTQTARGRRQPACVTGPRGQPVDAAIGLVPLDRIPASARALLELPETLPATASIALIEMAAVSGLALLPTAARDPWQTSTFGTGELIRIATEAGAGAILLGVGGSATNDLGLGALSALGLAFLDHDSRVITPPIPARWPQITRIEGRASPSTPPIRIACDVANPLLGPNGAAAIYGPQKGLRSADRPRLEAESRRLATLLCDHLRQPITVMEHPGAGAAGGIAFGLMAASGAKLLPGSDLVSAWLDLEHRLAAADLVVTGEGSFDESSLSGKGPGALATRALALGKTVHVFAGRIATRSSPPPNLHLHAITPDAMPLPAALKAAPGLLASALRATF